MCKEGTGCVLLSVLAIHSEMVSGVKVEITNCKEMKEERVFRFLAEQRQKSLSTSCVNFPHLFKLFIEF